MHPLALALFIVFALSLPPHSLQDEVEDFFHEMRVIVDAPPGGGSDDNCMDYKIRDINERFTRVEKLINGYTNINAMSDKELMEKCKNEINNRHNVVSTLSSMKGKVCDFTVTPLLACNKY
jgi:hypothetical protein